MKFSALGQNIHLIQLINLSKYPLNPILTVITNRTIPLRRLVVIQQQAAPLWRTTEITLFYGMLFN